MSLGDARDTAALRATAHPVRLRIMSLLTGAPMTAAEVARELGLTHANASYHLRNLHSAGMIVVAGEEKIRGGVAKRYRYDHANDRAAETPEQKRALFAALGSELVRRTAAGQFEAKILLGDGEFWIDRERWADLRGRFRELVAELHDAAQPPRSPGTVRTSTTVAMFEMQSGSAGDGGAE
ncbi:ArsR/SmtB family transcription factor [Actinoplanes sp. URMC 104]|uniref:ArsR/SmtB family transcription factor n=1 Tax=Actinoplanes sp. URMC 104 TaxID=3423409 RepID=UPI003F1BAA7B